ncbi:trypsin-like serine protease [Hansschlegelia zhihuaiae]|uniref:Trypsin-like serine protease n=1 Tax=Hansschlegelia zhihuaiae TaxID=405005 RepID=A0A4Q0MIQ7_9HYPH|nr:trypsin-like serine protease [Hansschlegelia zhihuaiae]RXF73490.1 trypsin-like serine protease [Hansschlegelia zhihuaiae]
MADLSLIRDTSTIRRAAPAFVVAWLAAVGAARADPADAAAAAAVAVQAVELIGGGRARVQDCSGALIEPDLVLTSGHCLDGASDPSRVAVFAYRDGKPAPQPIIAAAFSRHPSHVVGWRKTPGDPETRQREIASDLALIRLSAPVPGAAPLGFGTLAGATGGAAGTGGAGPASRSGAMKRVALASVRASTGSGARVVFASADKTVCGGDSGGPAVGTDGRLWGVVAAVLKPRGGCGPRIAITPVDPASEEFRRMRAGLGR